MPYADMAAELRFSNLRSWLSRFWQQKSTSRGQVEARFAALKFAAEVVKAPDYETPPAKSYIVANATNI